jgi:aspartate-semialdehyde dehydrogenase
MVGSVLMQRMIAERDFDHIDPVFFSASRAGGKGPAIGKEISPLGSATDLATLKTLDAIVTCQGGDYTNDIHPKLRAEGWNGYWIDAASTLRMADDAIIILDPVNRRVIDAAIRGGIRNYIGSNCTVGLLMMALAGLLERDLIEWMTCMTYQAASGAGAQSMRELLSQMGEAHLAAKDLLADPLSSILDIDREVAGILRDETFPTEHTTVPLAGSLIPWIDKDLGNGMSKEEWKGGAELNKMLGREKNPVTVESICVRIGAMRCHSQAVTIKLRRDVPLSEIEAIIAGAHEWVRVVPNTREDSIRQLTPVAVTGQMTGRLVAGASSRWWQYLGAFTVGDQQLWGAAEPLRRMIRILFGETGKKRRPRVSLPLMPRFVSRTRSYRVAQVLCAVLPCGGRATGPTSLRRDCNNFAE